MATNPRAHTPPGIVLSFRDVSVSCSMFGSIADETEGHPAFISWVVAVRWFPNIAHQAS
jgi:hypothetical protein